MRGRKVFGTRALQGEFSVLQRLLQNWADSSKLNWEKAVAFKRIAGQVFKEYLELNPDVDLQEKIFQATGFLYPATMKTALKNLADGRAASPELAISLLVLCKLDNQFHAFERKLETALFGRKTLEEVINWTPEYYNDAPCGTEDDAHCLDAAKDTSKRIAMQASNAARAKRQSQIMRSGLQMRDNGRYSAIALASRERERIPNGIYA